MTITYSQLEETKRIFSDLLESNILPDDIAALGSEVKFYNESNQLTVPCPLKQTELISALKGIESVLALKLSKIRFESSNTAKIDLQHALLFLFSTYCSSVNGYFKGDKKEVAKYLKKTDLNEAQSDPYRRMSANLYRTKDNRYYHIHGSLDATTTLKMIGMPAFVSGLTDYDEIVEKYQTRLDQFTCDELETLNVKHKQAGIEALKREDFLNTPHGKTINSKPIFEIHDLETETPPVPFTNIGEGEKPQILAGIKVLELCRIIAGPTIGKILAEYGATVIKVTSDDTLPDVPFFQIDGNMGKHTTNLNLKESGDRAKFEALLADADIVLDGYRTGVIEKLGYGPSKVTELAKKRGKGYIYASENCFGFSGEWSNRPGWQQIADCVSGVAWIQGQALGKNEPMIPPFPMSDYGTGCIVAISVLLALYKRNTIGGSYWCNSSLVQYDLLLMNQGIYPSEVWEPNVIKNPVFDPFRKLSYYDSVDAISGGALAIFKQLNPEALQNEDYFTSLYSEGFGGMIKVLKPVVEYSGDLEVGYKCSSRPNGSDAPEWW
ncbi:CoA-transferase family III domain-containing protein [Scheffersomyces coipomensis]|uniref:CoA-transferase family III domain-containing protein n=1 Tax=Scheffersomyces coipomensis TaxID=1788519 RepID=UPI00315D3217